MRSPFHFSKIATATSHLLIIWNCFVTSTSGDHDMIECAMRYIPCNAVKVEMRAMRLQPLTGR